MSAPAAARDLEPLGAQEVLEHMVREFHPRLYVACSFQKEASVILDMLVRIEPAARFFVLDTGVLFDETYDTWKRVEEHYGITIDRYAGEWVDGLWERDPDACCSMRKVEPLDRALAGVDAWITGLRRDQAPARAGTPKLGWDELRGKWKAAPLADWSDKDVWRYIAEHDVPYNPLHDRGFASIGCTHCTVPGAGREGRWAGTDRIECGLHLEPGSADSRGVSPPRITARNDRPSSKGTHPEDARPIAPDGARAAEPSTDDRRITALPPRS